MPNAVSQPSTTASRAVDLIQTMPKVELHMHVEGSLEPEQLFALAEKNKVPLPWPDMDALKAAYHFKDLAEFVGLFIQGTQVVKSAEDLYAITMAYLQKCHQDNINHTEVHCDIRTYVDYGFAPEMVIDGITAAFADARKNWGITGGMLPCFIRHLGVEKAEEDLKLLAPYRDRILAVGLAAVEVGYPPSLFKGVFAKARDLGIRAIAHAGEEGDPDYIWQAIDDIQVQRIDHGIRCLEDARLTETLRERQIPLTVCPFSNVALGVCERLEDHPLPAMLAAGLNVSIHSDDPAFFGGYLVDNMRGVVDHCGLTVHDLLAMQHNAVTSSFADASRKAELHQLLEAFAHEHGLGREQPVNAVQTG
jgi:adenosine deaminase